MNYYKEHSKEYIESTLNNDVTHLYPMLIDHLKPKSKILDVGFGSGRDSIYFNKLGYIVYSIDTEIEFVNHLKELGFNNTYQLSVLDIDYINQFDGIWANASLLHLKKDEIKEAFIKLKKALKPNGYMYASFKYGDFEGYDKLGRYFTYLNEESLKNILKDTGFEIVDIKLTKDVSRDLMWINVVVK